MNIMDFFKLDDTPSRLDKMGDSFLEDKNSLDAEEALELFSDLIETKSNHIIDHVNNHTQYYPKEYYKRLPAKRKEMNNATSDSSEVGR